MRVRNATSMLLILALAAGGCGVRHMTLPHAVYASAVPIYPGATLEDAMGSTSGGDSPESMSDGMAWFFDVEAPADQMVAFYERNLPGAKRDPVWQQGTRLVWIPPGASPGEEVSIEISENDLTIHEEVRPGRRPGNPNEMSQGVAQGLSGAAGSSDENH